MERAKLLLAACVVAWVGGAALAAAQDCEPTKARPGLCNPLGDMPEQPWLRDDEAIVVGFEDGMQTFAVQDAELEEPGLSVLARREGGEPVVAKGGGVLGGPVEQLVLVSHEGAGMRLELVSLAACVSGLPCPLVLGQYDFEPSNPSSEVSLDIADVVEDAPGDEVLLAYESEQDGEARVHVTLLSFADAGTGDPASFDHAIEPEVLGDAVIEYVYEGNAPEDAYDLGLLRQQDGERNFLRALVMRTFRSEPPVILVAHATPDPKLAVVALSVEALMGGQTEPATVLDAFSISDAAADQGSWDVTLAAINNAAGSLVYLSRMQDVQTIDVRALRYERPPSAQCSIGDGDRCDSGPKGGQPCTSHADCPPAPDTLIEHAQPWTGWLCYQGSNCPLIDLLGGRWRGSTAPLAPPHEWNGDRQLALMVQSARGPLIQTFELQGSEPARVVPIETDVFAWPRGSVAIDARPTFDATADVEAFTASVILHRATANRFGSPSGAAAFYFDREPSYYVALPDRAPWSDMGRLLRARRTFDDETESGPQCTGVSCELRISDEDGPLDAFPASVLAFADVDGDSGYYRLPARSSSGLAEFDLYLGPPMQITLHDLTAPEIILEEPPKHVDYLRDEEGGGGMHNVSQSPGFSVAYRNEATKSVQVQSEAKVTYAFGESTESKLSAKMSAAVKIFSASAETSLTQRFSRDLETTEAALALESASTTLTQTFETSNDDQLFVVQRAVDIWRFPVIGLENELGEEQARHAFVDLVVPGEGAHSAHSGRNQKLYNPSHINGNVLSYPRFGDVSDVGDAASSELQPFSAGGSCESTLCVGGPNDGNACDAILQCVGPEPLDTPLWAESSFDVSADTTTTLALSNAESLGRSLAYSDTIAQSTSFDVSAELGFSYLGIGGSVSGSYDYTVSEKHTFASSELTTNATSSTNEIALKAPPLGAPEETYSFAPAFYFERTGAVKVTHHVQLPTGPASFWSLHYDRADPALHLPFRIVCKDSDCNLNDGAARNQMKGLTIAVAADDARDRHHVSSTPQAGTRLSLQAQVWNLSVGDSTGELTVRFEVGPEGADAIEDRTLVGDAVIDDLAPGEMTVASVDWDTTDFGDPNGETLDYRIWVTLDPENAIEETHEWLDRDDDPLLDARGRALDPRVDPKSGEQTYLEKGQNNEGWSSLSLGPSDETCATLPKGCPEQEGRGPDGPSSDGGLGRDGSVPDRGDGSVPDDGGADAGGDAGDAGGGGGGCGCSVPGSTRGSTRGSLPLALLALGMAWLRQRRRQGRVGP